MQYNYVRVPSVKRPAPGSRDRYAELIDGWVDLSRRPIVRRTPLMTRILSRMRALIGGVN